jgi:hypothetical protein
MGIPAATKALQAFTRRDPIVNDREALDALENELYGTSDRVTAVMLGASVETALEKLLASRMRDDLNSDERSKLFGFDGAGRHLLREDHHRLRGEDHRADYLPDLNLIKLLRNEFAHSRIPFDFQTPQVVAVCNELQVPKLPDSNNSFPLMTTRVTSRFGIAGIPPSWMLFVSACHNIAYRMLVKRDGIREGDFIFVDDEPLP